MFLATPAFAQAASPAANPMGMLEVFILPLAFILLMYFFMIRPQQKRAKVHQTMISNIKRNDTVVLNSGMIGKVTRIEDAEIMVEIASGVNVRIVKTMVAEVRTKGEPVANDTKPAA